VDRVRKRPPYVGTAVLYAIGAAMLFAAGLAVAGSSEEGVGGTIFVVALFVGYGTLLTSWFVLPLGVALGFVFPRLVLDVSGRTAVVRAVLVGSACGIVAAACLKLMYRESTFLGLAGVLAAYCGVVAALIALHFRRLADSEALLPVV
jgi:hypothetical protein